MQKETKRHLLILAIGWFVLQLLLIRQFGIVTNLEASKYLAQADYFIEHGHVETGNFVFYSTQILLIATCKKLGFGYWPAVVIQMIFNAFSLYCFYRLAQKFTQNTKLAFWVTAAFLSMYYYQLYNVYLFTESLYFSFSIIFFYLLMRLKNFSFKSFSIILLGLAVLYFTRPVGIFFIPATFAYVVLKFFRSKAVLIFCTAGIAGVLGFAFILNRSLNSGGELDFLLPYLDERIICGVPTISKPHVIAMPVEQDSVQGLFYIITHHWKLFFSLSMKRLLAFFGIIRSYYSLFHNVFVAFYFYTIYLGIVAGIRRWNKQTNPQVVFILTLVTLTAITTALSCDEWHNRFILAIFPFLLLLASLSLSGPLSKNKLNDKPEN